VLCAPHADLYSYSCGVLAEEAIAPAPDTPHAQAHRIEVRVARGEVELACGDAGGAGGPCDQSF